MAHKDPSSAAGLAALNGHLATRSYVDGYTPSAEDVNAFGKISRPVDDGKFPHVSRWFNHINSFSACQRKRWTGAVADQKEQKSAAPAKPAAAAKPVAAAAEEEEEAELDFDALGDDSGADKDAVDKIVKGKSEEKAAAKKVGPVAKSTVILDVKPQGSETDMKSLEAQVRAIKQDGLVWGGSEHVPVAYGVKKLRIISIIVDDLVSVDDLQEKIESFEDCQSTDIHAFNKV
jgi:elongation factor 1-beta